MNNLQAFAILVTLPFLGLAYSAQAMVLPPNIQAYLESKDRTVLENGRLPLTAESGDLLRFMSSNWPQVADNFQTVAPDTRRQALVVVAAEVLSPRDYLQFINRICDLREAGHATPTAIDFILWASMGKKGFLAFNYDHPDVTPTIERLERIAMKDSPKEWKEFFSVLKSGQLKQTTVAEALREHDMLPEDLNANSKEAYHLMVGGSIVDDTRLLLTKPAVAITSLANPMRSRWSMLVAISLPLVITLGLILLVRKFWRRGRRAIQS